MRGPYLLLAALAVFAPPLAFADSIVVQMGAGTTPSLNAGPDRVQTVGGNFIFSLTLNDAVNETFYTPAYDTLCTTCTGTVTGTLTATTLNITDQTVSGTGSGSFAQQFSDASSGSAHTYTALLSSAISIALTNGDTLVITPLAGTGAVETAPSVTNGAAVTATFLLEATPVGAPEPSGALLLLMGAGAFFVVRKRRARR